MAILISMASVTARAAGDDALSFAFSNVSRAAAVSRSSAKDIQAVNPPPGAAPAWPRLDPNDLHAGLHHTLHRKIFGKYASGNNLQILQAIDLVQSTAPDGGGFFIGARAKPAESPIGYALKLFGRQLLKPSRKSSFCTGATYAVFIEALNSIFSSAPLNIAEDRLEAMRLQEPDGARREDGIKFWGHWNDNDMGNQYALVQYSGMGKVVAPREAQAGDFMNIRWRDGHSHAVVFLGWCISTAGVKSLLIWSSQAPTGGMGDYLIPLTSVTGVKVVRLSNVGALATFDVRAPVVANVGWDAVGWETPQKSRPPRHRPRARR